MTTVSALARLHAARNMAAEPLTRFRHRHLSDRPLVVIPLTMAGEAGTPLAAMVGNNRRAPTLLVVGQPRNRDQRFAFAAALGRLVMDHIDSCRQDRRQLTPKVSGYTRTPQLLVPNPGGVKALADLGRVCRYRQTTGDHAVPGIVPELGKWLTFLAEQAEQAGTSMLLAVTDLLAEHWATGQSALEDRNLASIMAWIEPPSGLTVAQALEDAENPTVWPPAGPTTSPEFDNTYLSTAIKRFDAARAAGDPAAIATAQADLHDLIGAQIKPTWRMMWDAIALLRGVAEAPRTSTRLAQDRKAFTGYSDYQESEDPRPQRRRDDAIGAARRLSRLERAQADFEADMAFDDPFVLADRRSAGEAFAGEVVEAEPGRVVVSAANRRTLRPRAIIRTLDPTRLADGTTLISPTMGASHKAVVISTTPDGAASLVEVEVTAGMGGVKSPNTGNIPTAGQSIAYLPDPGWRPWPVFPERDDAPWTHTTDTPGSDAPAPDETAAEAWGDDS
ncbi:hypothetical protein [Actinokineospora spheciospongiae]|uniref:hypothetical protein n=1 Tax=Actinokineospora spheciospongiae TaxID=909613 RepID=UPI000D711CD6|nr:hypothetical protein [Actinokineospora spheciospongiae]PWW60223.1 hypothetical protein DFQ13_10719 [Actinokineospora spheciospongiae]